MEVAVWPQYLHVYEDLSDPSYALCLPLAKPSGCFGHGELTRALTDLAVCPQKTHVYTSRASPSKSACRPFAKPDGCFGQGEESNARASRASAPQYLHRTPAGAPIDVRAAQLATITTHRIRISFIFRFLSFNGVKRLFIAIIIP